MRISHGRTGLAKAAELASGLGAILLGAGIALLAPSFLDRFALAFLVTGLFVHAAGMTLKYRIETREGATLWWESFLFWLCWVVLLSLGLWVASSVLTAI